MNFVITSRQWKKARWARAVFAALALAAVVTFAAGPAAAGGDATEEGPVIVPTGSTLRRGLPVLVEWKTSHWPSPTVDIGLHKVSPGPKKHFILLAAKVKNDGKTYVDLPDSLPCSPDDIFQIFVGAERNGAQYDSSSAYFKLSCEGGSLTVVKTVINASTASIAGAAFPVDVTCGHGGPNRTLSLSAANNFQDSVKYIPAGTTCTVNEPALKAPRGCRWVTTYPGGTSAVIGEAGYKLEVRNRLSCQGAVRPGSLTVTKRIVIDSAILPPDAPFLVQATCSDVGPNVAVTLSSANRFTQSVFNIPAGAVCTAARRIQPVPPAPAPLPVQVACSTGGPDVAVTLSSANNFTRTIFNMPADAVCTISEKDRGALPQAAPYQVQFDCFSSGADVQLFLSKANNFTRTIPDIPVNSVCSITERAPSVPPALARLGCAWATTYPKGRTAAMPDPAKALKLPVVNRWTCAPQSVPPGVPPAAPPVVSPGSLTIIKKVVIASPIIPPAAPFLVQVNCSTAGPNVLLSLSDANNFTRTVSSIPANSLCTISEQAPVVPANLAELGCGWATTYPDGQTAAMPEPAAALTRTVVNRWTCAPHSAPPVAPPGSLTVLKKVVINSPINPPTAPFLVQVDCSTAGPNVLLSLSGANSFTQTVSSIPANSSCSVSEQAPVVPASLAALGCTWTTTYPDGQNVSMPSPAAALTRTVLNTWACTQPPVVLCADPAHVPAYNNGSTSANNVPNGQCYRNNVGECLYNWRTPAAYNDGLGWNKMCPSGVAGAACCGWTTPPVPPTGTLTVIKTVVNNTAGPVPAAPFLVQVNCPSAGINVPLSLSNANSFTQTVSSIPVNSACTITEVAPVVTAAQTALGCGWTTTYPAGQSAVMPSPATALTRTVLNTWNCVQPPPGCCKPDWTGAPPSYYNNPAMIAACSATTQALCTGNAFVNCLWVTDCSGTPPVSCADPVHVPAYNNGSTSANNVPIDQCYRNNANECRYNWRTPASYNDGLGWNHTCPPAIAGAACCNWTAPAPPAGKLTVIKTVVNNTAGPVPAAPFLVQVNCPSAGINVPLSLSNANSFTQTVSSIPVNSACTITEVAPVVTAAQTALGCGWTTTYPDGQNANMPNPAAALTRHVLNTWSCNQPPAGCCRPDWAGVPPSSYNYPAMTAACSATTQALCTGNAFVNCLWDTSCTGTPPVSCSDPAHVPAYNNGSTSANNVPIGQCYKNNAGECRYNWRAPSNYNDSQGWNAGCPSAIAGAACCGWNVPVPPTGTLTVIKTVVNNTAGPVPTAPFLVQVACPSAGINVPLSLSNANNFTQTVSSVPVNSVCSITEVAPVVTAAQAALGCGWTTTYPDGQNATMPSPAKGLVRHVLNTWTCVPPTGTLTVVKTVVNNTAGSVPSNPFLVQVNCPSAGPNVLLSLTPFHFTQTVSSIPVNSACTITEVAPVVTAAQTTLGCGWTTTYPDGQNATMPSPAKGLVRHVVNTWTCTPPTTALTVIKVVVNHTATPPPAAPFLVQVNCSNSGPSVLLSLSGANNFTQTVSAIPANSVCSITEQAPVVPAALAALGCKWTATYPNPNGQKSAMPGPAKGLIRHVVNTWDCVNSTETGTGLGPDPGVLTVKKTVVINPAATPPVTAPFLVQVDCAPTGPNKLLSLSDANNFTQSVFVVPVNSVCTLTEQPPVVSAALTALGCSWTTTYPDGQNVTMPNPSAYLTRTVLNSWDCQPPASTGKITLIKKIRNRTSTPTPATPFQVKLECKPGGLHQVVQLTSPDKLRQTVIVPLKSVCAIAEIPPAAPRACRWETSYPNDQEGETGTEFVIENELLCDETGTLTVTKKVKDLRSTEQAPDPAGGFPVTVTCKNGFTKTMRLYRDDSQDITGLPVGTVCMVTEAAPSDPRFSAPLSCPASGAGGTGAAKGATGAGTAAGAGAARGAGGTAAGGITGAMSSGPANPAIWNAASYLPGQAVTIAPGANPVKITNSYRCVTADPR